MRAFSAELRQRRGLPAQPQELSVERQEIRVPPLDRELTLKPRTFECVRVRGIGPLAQATTQPLVLGTPAPSDGLDELRVAVVHEIEEGRGFGVLLAHEQQRD